MRDWNTFVRSHLKLPGLRPERESRIVKELASQLEDFYREAIARGETDAEADAHAARQIRDWERMTQDLWLADRPNARPPIERLADRLDGIPQTKRSWLAMLWTSCAMRVTRFGNSERPRLRDHRHPHAGSRDRATSAIFSVERRGLRPQPYPGRMASFACSRSCLSRQILGRAGDVSRLAQTIDRVRPRRRLHRRHHDVRGGDGPERVPPQPFRGTCSTSESLAMLGRTFTGPDLPGRTASSLSYRMAAPTPVSNVLRRTSRWAASL